ncbi:hypothetical protein PG996_005828, partial [Apiospora saccharicola]
MALEAPLKSTTGNILSAFSPHTEYPVSSPESPRPHSHYRTMSSSVGSVESNSLRPSSIARASSVNNHLMSPSDIVGPSPVTSVGTEVTEIEDEASDDAKLESASEHSESRQPQLLMLRTNITDQVRQSLSEEAVSVIHAPESFQSWVSTSQGESKQSPRNGSPKNLSPKNSPKPENINVPPLNDHSSKAKSPGLPTPPPISTDVRPARFSLEGATPRAQNLKEVESSLSDTSRIRSSSTSSLELIPESREPETDAEPETEADYEDEFVTPSGDEDMDIRSLKTALGECWTLCNTLATLSTHHRERVFITSGTPDDHERAWKCCWKLCQRLYDNRDEDDTSFNVRVNLDLCRDFCQALFDVRQRKDETADSVLRVSFELNNHLYSAQDNRNLPEAFRERTLDFYITLCHRLMKQRNELAEETDSLLRACWSLAEMLFSIRQNKRDGKVPDEELLGSAVQACWELCDIFREGWTQIRPDRGTPRPSQTNFFNYQPTSDREQDGRASRTSNRSKRDSLRSAPQDKPKKPPPVPETPVTEFEDTPISPDQSPQVPNIMVFGTDNSRSGGRWSSSASNLSGYSQSSQRTSSTVTTATTAEDVNISRLKMLIVKAAMNVVIAHWLVWLFTDPYHIAAELQKPGGCRLLIPASIDAAIQRERVTANDMAKSIAWMTHRSGQYGFLRELFKLVYGFQTDEAETRKN